MTDHALARRNDEQLDRARNLLAQSDEDRKRFAARAVLERDHEALWSILEARLQVKRASPKTFTSYRKGVLTLLDAWTGVDLLRPRRSDAELYVMNLSAPDREVDPNDRVNASKRNADGRAPTVKPLSPASVRQRVAAAKAFYEALRWTGVTDADPFALVDLPKLEQKAQERAKRKAYTDAELERMLRHAGDHDDYLIVYLGAHAGLRVSEMLALEWSDLDLRDGRLLVRSGKGRKTASVTMSRELVAFLTDVRRERFLDGRAAGPVLVCRSPSSVYLKVQRMWCDGFAGDGEIPPFTKGVHGLRHYSGIKYARVTDDLRKVRDHLRHASMSTSEIYMGAAEDTDEVRDWTFGGPPRHRDDS